MWCDRDVTWNGFRSFTLRSLDGTLGSLTMQPDLQVFLAPMTHPTHTGLPPATAMTDMFVLFLQEYKPRGSGEDMFDL